MAQRVPIGVPAGPDASERPTRGGDNLFFSKAVMDTLIGLREESVAGNALEVWDRSYAHMNDVLSGDVWGQPPIASQRGIMTLEEWLEPVFYDSTVHTWDLSPGRVFIVRGERKSSGSRISPLPSKLHYV